MKRVGIVSCDKWADKISEDLKLKDALNELGVESEIVSWQQPLDKNFDLLILRSVWGYQDDFNNFRKWLLTLDEKGVPLLNDINMILENIQKEKQFNLLKKNKIETIKTYFLKNFEASEKNIIRILESRFGNEPCVIKPTISGSGKNTYAVNCNDEIPNSVLFNEIYGNFEKILENNPYCGLMFQPFIPEIINGEYSCIFIDGVLTHTMLRFPAIFHKKIKTQLVTNVPPQILDLAKRVESINEYSGYLYMRVDMVLINGEAKIMEVELAEPDLLTKYIDDKKIQNSVVRTLSKRIKERADRL